MLEISHDFECGAVEAVRFLPKDRIRFDAPLNGSPQGMWFAFRVRNGRGRTLTFEQGNVKAMLGAGGYGAVRPVVREGTEGQWRRLEEDSVRWEPEALEFSFRVPLWTDETYVAYCYPYGLNELDRFLADHASSPFLRRETLCRTSEGRDFPVLWLGDADSPGEKQLCVIVARQHAGEVPGSYVLEGILGACLAETEEGRWARENLVFLVAPMVDLDGVEAGRYGKDRPPRDFNRDWCAKPVHPEVRALIPALDAAARRHRYRLFLDLHAPGPGDVSFWLPSRLSHGTPQYAETWNLGQLLEEAAPPDCPVRVEDFPFHVLNWSQEPYEQTATYFQTFRYGVLAATLEATYHRHAGGGLVTPEGWRGVGRGFHSALVRHLRSDARKPVPAPESWGAPPPTLEFWTLPAVPQGVRLEEEGPASLRVIPTEASNRIWATCDRFFPITGDSDRPVRLRLDGGGETGSVEVIAYFYREGLPTAEWRHFYLEPGAADFVYSGQGKPEDRDAVRLSVRIDGLKAPLRFSFEV